MTVPPPPAPTPAPLPPPPAQHTNPPPLSARLADIRRLRFFELDPTEYSGKPQEYPARLPAAYPRLHPQMTVIALRLLIRALRRRGSPQQGPQCRREGPKGRWAWEAASLRRLSRPSLIVWFLYFVPSGHLQGIILSEHYTGVYFKRPHRRWQRRASPPPPRNAP